MSERLDRDTLQKLIQADKSAGNCKLSFGDRGAVIAMLHPEIPIHEVDAMVREFEVLMGEPETL